MKRLDVPTMVTGVIVIGFAAMGLMIILGRSPRNRKTNERKK